MAYRETARTLSKRREDRERIVRVAQRLIAEQGFRGVQVTGVAEAAEVATGTVYRHFPSKEELFAEVFRQAAGREVEATAAGAVGPDIRTRLTGAVETFARRALEHPTLAYALLVEPVDPAIEAERLTFRRAYRALFSGLLTEGMKRKELSRQDPEVVAAALVGAIGEALVSPLSPQAFRPASEAVISELIRFCLRAVTLQELTDERPRRRRTA